MSRDVVVLGEDDHEQSWQLGRLAFGVGPEHPPPTWPRPFVTIGVRDGRGRLVAKAALQDYEQWWGGRRVPMGGVAGVAVHPDARGQGLASQLLRELLALSAGRGQAVSALYPTVVGLYRPLGWEVVGSLDETVLRTGDLAVAGSTSGVVVRAAEPEDAAAVTAVYDAYAQDGAGLLSRTGPLFASGPAGADADLTTVAVDAAGQLHGYLRYDRGRGYREQGELFVWELLADSGAAAAALLRALAGWHPVAPQTRWRGSTAGLDLLLPAAVPAPDRRQPWMLRIVDPVAAVAARGWAADCEVDFHLVGDPGPAGSPSGVDGVGQSWRLVVRDGLGRLEPGPSQAPTLHLRGLALLWSGAADTAAVRRAGLLDGPLPGLDAAVAGAAPGLLDYF